ncbi:hypothetical protein FH972_021264 [Carpinus fangiana]|uniref:Uncharacterized protein n=1 Tax=Carpinus fangiana TaxID=176857 RepID=A0A5N6KPF8_9ROSI|nr:hypothetical protein FH972_021264 [Carpinus fangiana]
MKTAQRSACTIAHNRLFTTDHPMSMYHNQYIPGRPPCQNSFGYSSLKNQVKARRVKTTL